MFSLCPPQKKEEAGFAHEPIVWSLAIVLKKLDKNRLDSRTLRPVNVLGLLVFSNNIKNGFSDIRDIKRRIMACPLKSGLSVTKDHRKWHHSVDRIQVPIRLSCLSSAVTEIVSIEYWRDVEMWVIVVQRHWKWRQSIDRNIQLYISVVIIYLSCTIFELFDVQNIVTLKSRLRVIEGHWK